MKSSACNDDFKARGDISNENRKYLVDQDISYDEVEAQHNWHVEDAYKITWGKEAENSFVGVKTKLVQAHQICEED